MLLTGWSDTSATASITRASLMGDVDAIVGWPWSISDPQFLATIGDLLADWATEHGRYLASAQLLADPDDGDAQELRDTVIRWALPISFHDTRSASGNALSDELPAGAQLPACSSRWTGAQPARNR